MSKELEMNKFQNLDNASCKQGGYCTATKWVICTCVIFKVFFGGGEIFNKLRMIQTLPSAKNNWSEWFGRLNWNGQFFICSCVMKIHRKTLCYFHILFLYCNLMKSWFKKTGSFKINKLYLKFANFPVYTCSAGVTGLWRWYFFTYLCQRQFH